MAPARRYSSEWHVYLAVLDFHLFRKELRGDANTMTQLPKTAFSPGQNASRQQDRSSMVRATSNSLHRLFHELPNKACCHLKLGLAMSQLTFDASPPGI
mmetsp:Transcript_28782/g.66469  ORF Transcript_28782/g.66469 Transcript_28782/m.66469 type:complete len:99 (-) Transcript_28782:504-800(-)